VSRSQRKDQVNADRLQGQAECRKRIISCEIHDRDRQAEAFDQKFMTQANSIAETHLTDLREPSQTQRSDTSGRIRDGGGNKNAGVHSCGKGGGPWSIFSRVPRPSVPEEGLDQKRISNPLGRPRKTDRPVRQTRAFRQYSRVPIGRRNFWEEGDLQGRSL